MTRDWINPPALDMGESPISYKAKIELLVCNYKFRKLVYDIRKKWDIPLKNGLEKEPSIESIDTIPCNCIDRATPIPSHLYGWDHKAYWSWHTAHKEGVHNKQFYQDCKKLHRSSPLPQEEGWLNLVLEIVLFHEASLSSIPQRTESHNGVLVIDTERLEPESATHPYDLSLRTKSTIPKLDVSIYRGMNKQEQKRLLEDIERLSESLPSATSSDWLNIHVLAVIADLKRLGKSNEQVAAELQSYKKYSLSSTSISTYYSRAKDLGL